LRGTPGPPLSLIMGLPGFGPDVATPPSLFV
jgi:hypothetical protein